MLDLYISDNIKYNKVDITEPENLNMLIKLGGKKQVPFLDDKENNIAMYESDDIIKYLKK